MRDVQFVRNIAAVDDEQEMEILGWSLFPDDYLPVGQAQCTQCDCTSSRHSVYEFEGEIPLVLCDCRIGPRVPRYIRGQYCYTLELRQVWIDEQSDSALML